MIEKTLAKEIREANGNGSREAKFQLIRKIKHVQEMLSNPNATRLFNDAIKIHGRVPVAICVAVTIYERRDRIDYWNFQWALDVIRLWWNRPKDIFGVANIDDGLNCERICDYAKDFILCTSEVEYDA